MLLTYEHVLSNYTSCEYFDIVERIVNKGANVNAKGENGKKIYTFSMWKQP
jgi:hypothetical protein